MVSLVKSDNVVIFGQCFETTAGPRISQKCSFLVVCQYVLEKSRNRNFICHYF